MKKRFLHMLLSLLVAFAMGIGTQNIPMITADAADVSFLAPEPANVPSGGIGTYISGGRNVEAYRYVHTDGYPPFPDKTRFIGTLQGTWYTMGKEYGARSGDAVRVVSDIWWKQEVDLYGKAQTLKAIKLYEAQIKALDPNLVEFMKGIADGAADWLNQSIYANAQHPLCSTNYERVMAVNVYDEWVMIHPGAFPDGSSTYGGTATAPPVKEIASCSAFAARGAATADGRTIAAHNRHTPYDPRVYQQTYVIAPPGGNTAWVLSNCPQVAANQIVNEKGLTVILLFGGASNPQSWNYPGGPYVAEGFGVPWFHLLLHVGTHADTAAQAIEMLTKGTPEYRDRTGRKSLLRGGGWIFLVSDEKTMAVVEVTADRYAVRHPGDLTGPGWTSPDYIVATNMFICDFSYDKNNRRTNVPLSIFNVLPLSDIRFWTLMWDMKHRFGRIDRYMAQHIMSGLYKNDKDTGERIDCAEKDGKIALYGELFASTEGAFPVTLGFGTNDGKIAVLDGNRTSVYWTLGNPSHWQGAWDAYRFKGGAPP